MTGVIFLGVVIPALQVLGVTIGTIGKTRHVGPGQTVTLGKIRRPVRPDGGHQLLVRRPEHHHHHHTVLHLHLLPVTLVQAGLAVGQAQCQAAAID